MPRREVPNWTPEQLAAGARQATEIFVTRRLNEPARHYAAMYEGASQRITDFLRATNDLADIAPGAFVENKETLDDARYLAGPPISADDLRTIVADRLSSKKLKDPVAARVADLIRRSLDPYRFPWVASDRPATDAERSQAICWTAGLIAVEKLRTSRRNAEARDQEEVVRQIALEAGYEMLPSPGQDLRALDELPRGTFTRELKVAGTKADVPIRLHDGRLLAIECKASNSSVNSIKRLNREVGGKADQWRTAYGREIVPCAVISGVFDVSTLIKAQDEQGVFLVWQHDLEPLRVFISPDSP